MKTEEYGNRPSGQPSERIQGRLIRWKGTNYMEFQPKQTKEDATRAMMKETKNLTFYRNVGKKESSYSLHVNVSDKEKDPAAAIIDKVQTELAPLTKGEVKLTPVRKYLADEEGLKVWHRKKDKRLCCMIEIDTTQPVTMSSTLLKKAADINKIINSNKF